MQSILVVEDDHSIRVTLRDALEAHGYLVFSAANGADGLAVLSRVKDICLILLDWQMPLVSGEEFLKAKMRADEYKDIPVILVSAVANSIHPIGVKEIIAKPFDLDYLLRAVAKHATESQDTPPSASQAP